MGVLCLRPHIPFPATTLEQSPFKGQNLALHLTQNLPARASSALARWGHLRCQLIPQQKITLACCISAPRVASLLGLDAIHGLQVASSAVDDPLAEAKPDAHTADLQSGRSPSKPNLRLQNPTYSTIRPLPRATQALPVPLPVSSCRALVDFAQHTLQGGGPGPRPPQTPEWLPTETKLKAKGSRLEANPHDLIDWPTTLVS
jgi:hypothetical protein